MRLKIEAFAPMPSARMSATATLKPGLWRRVRQA
jgi:hypothetical protein